MRSTAADARRFSSGGTEPWRTRRRPVAALAILIAAIGITVPAAALEVAYLHIEANEGGSSGGHVAVRIGGEVYHFQHHAPGGLRLRRDEAELFVLRYALLENRPIHETRLAVSDETAELIHDAFARRLQIESAHFERLAALRADVRLLAEPNAAWPVRGAAYFVADPFALALPADPPPPSLIDLRARVVAALGPGGLDQLIAAQRAALAAARPRAAADSAVPVLDRYPVDQPTASTRHGELLERLTALEVLAAAPPLRAGAWRVSAQAAPLADGERRALRQFAAALADGLAALPLSTRPDWGYPMLLGMARLAAIDLSLGRGELVVLDAFPDGAPSGELPDTDQRAAFFAALGARTERAMAARRTELAELARVREGDYSALETAMNLHIEVERARGGAPLRVTGEALLPARAARRSEHPPPRLRGDEQLRELNGARAAADAYAAQLNTLYGYNLISRNCVSEIFVTIDAALALANDSPAAVEAAVRRHLGGVVQRRGTLAFIPFVSSAAVERSWRVADTRTYPSYRARALAAPADDQPAWRRWLRESNTLTSTVYRRGARDSTFLFFTDGAPAVRPLFGVVNLLVGLGAAAGGVATSPFDSGARLSAGLRGALWSLPELAFVNIRKGTTAWIDPPVADR